MGFAEVVIFENDQERDRKTCIALDQKVTGSNRELAEWLLNHPKYTNVAVAAWLECGETRIRDLRNWAKRGFEGKPFRSGKSRAHAKPKLKSLDNSESDEMMPSEEEADESWQNDLYDQACLLLERMAEATRQRFFAEIRKVYGHV